MSRTRLALGLWVIAAGLAGLAILGPLVTGAVHYRVTETLRSQTIGLDAVALLLVVPLACVAGALVRRGHAAGEPLALGIGAYTAYMAVQYVVGPDYAHLRGDDERLFPLVLTLFVAGWAVTLGAWAALGARALPRPSRRDRIALGVLAGVAFSRYLPALADAMGPAPHQPSYRAGPGFFWTIALLDLGVFVPLTIATLTGLARGRPWAGKALYLLAGWLGLVGPAVAGMAVAMQVRHDPGATAGDTVLMVALGAAFAGFALHLFRPLLARPAGGGRVEWAPRHRHRPGNQAAGGRPAAPDPGHRDH